MRTSVSVASIILFVAALDSAGADLSDVSAKQLCQEAASGRFRPNVINIAAPPTGTKIPPARRDGKTDVYLSLKSAAAYFSGLLGNEHKVLLFPKGSYYVGRFINLPKDPANLSHITFRNSRNFRIIGCNAKISVMGNFVKLAVQTKSGSFISNRKAITPLRFENCDQFSVIGVDLTGEQLGYGLELNGNVDKMGRDARLYEQDDHLLSTYGCSNYQIHNLFIHHGASDGLLLGGGLRINLPPRPDREEFKYKADRSAMLVNVFSAFNSRQALSVIQLSLAIFHNSIFYGSGRTGNNIGVLTAKKLHEMVATNSVLPVNPKYKGFSPQGGVDIEPNYNSGWTCVNCSPGSTYVPRFVGADLKTGNIHFHNCRFAANIGSQLVSGVKDGVHGVTLYNSQIYATDVPANEGSSVFPNSYHYPVWLDIYGASIQDSIISTGPGAMVLKRLANVQRSTIRTRGHGLVVDGHQHVAILDSKIIGEHTSPLSGYLPYFRSTHPGAMFARNEIHIPSAARRLDAPTQVVGFVQSVCNPDSNSLQVFGNRFYVDGELPAGVNPFVFSYLGTRVSGSGDWFQTDRIQPLYGLTNGAGLYVKDNCN